MLLLMFVHVPLMKKTKVADLVRVEAMAPIEDIENTNLEVMEGDEKEARVGQGDRLEAEILPLDGGSLATAEEEGITDSENLLAKLEANANARAH